MESRGHKNLKVWQKAMDLAEEIYGETKKFPPSETYGLSKQLRRSVVSIPANIAEGSGREHKREFLHFISIAKGLLRELETHLLIAGRLNYLPEEKL